MYHRLKCETKTTVSLGKKNETNFVNFGSVKNFFGIIPKHDRSAELPQENKTKILSTYKFCL